MIDVVVLSCKLNNSVYYVSPNNLFFSWDDWSGTIRDGGGTIGDGSGTPRTVPNRSMNCQGILSAPIVPKYACPDHNS